MSAAAIIILLQQFGPPAIGLVEMLIAKAEAGQSVTLAEWQAQQTSLSQTAADRMKAQLIAAGIDPASPQGVQMLALAK